MAYDHNPPIPKMFADAYRGNSLDYSFHANGVELFRVRADGYISIVCKGEEILTLSSEDFSLRLAKLLEE